MEYTNVRYSITRQIAQYEPETMEVSAVLQSGDDLQSCAAKLKADTMAALMGTTPEAPAKETKPKKEKKAETKEDKPKKEKPAKKPAKKKNVAYDRNVQAHKTAFGELALEIEPKWQKDTGLKAKVKELSVSMEGQDMFDGEGEILESFRSALTEGLASDDDDL